MTIKTLLALVIALLFASCNANRSAQSTVREVATVSDSGGERFEIASITNQSEIRALSHLIEIQGAPIHFRNMAKVSCKTEMDQCSIAVRHFEHDRISRSFCYIRDSGQCVHLEDGLTVFTVSSQIGDASQVYREMNFESNSRLVQSLRSMVNTHPDLAKAYRRKNMDGTEFSQVELNLTDGRIYCIYLENSNSESSGTTLEINKCYIEVDSTKNPLP